jgi:dihydroflavonol-4-reductase
MPLAFVTGATGFVGGHLVRRLCARGYKVRVLVREGSCFDQANSDQVEVIKGHLGEVSKIRGAVNGCDVIYHAAADYRLWTRRPSEMYETNVLGTRNVMESAWRADVPKIVYTSTVGTIEIEENGVPADESTFLTLHARTGHYKRSKFLAEKEAIKYAKGGLPVVIVNPSAPVGSHDWKPTPTGRVVVDFLNGKMPMYLETGLNLVDVEDVAEGHILAAERGIAGERYILGNENLTLHQILLLLSDLTGIPAPSVKCPYPLALTAAWFSEAFTWITFGKEPRVPREGVYMAKKMMFFDSTKAQRELGFSPGPVKLALSKAVAWFSERGYLNRPLASSFTPIHKRQSDIVPVEDEAVALVK